MEPERERQLLLAWREGDQDAGAKLIRAGKLSPVELTQAKLKQIEALDGKLNSFIKLTADMALADARQAEAEIGKGEWVVLRSDWDQYADDEAKFLNADENGPHTPGPTAEVIQYLIDKGIVGWGSQCIGTDAGLAGGMTPPFPAHNLLHANNCFGLASLANLDQLPAKGAILIVAPLKILKGTGSPIRALALKPKG